MIQREFTATIIDGERNAIQAKTVTVAIEASYSLLINQNNQQYRINIIASPEYLEDLAMGYLLSEGIVSNVANIKSIQVKKDQILAEVANTDEDARLWFEVRSSGCVGVKLQHDGLGEIVKSKLMVAAKVLCAMQETLVGQSNVWRATGGCHIAGIFSQDGTLLHVAEDVGRHNALDKVIGMSARAGEDRADLVLATSGRLAAGMVAKAARAGFPILLSKAAPLDGGIDLAKRVGITLCAFVRGQKMNIYTHPGRVLTENNGNKSK